MRTTKAGQPVRDTRRVLWRNGIDSVTAPVSITYTLPDEAGLAKASILTQDSPHGAGSPDKTGFTGQCKVTVLPTGDRIALCLSTWEIQLSSLLFRATPVLLS